MAAYGPATTSATTAAISKSHPSLPGDGWCGNRSTGWRPDLSRSTLTVTRPRSPVGTGPGRSVHRDNESIVSYYVN